MEFLFQPKITNDPQWINLLQDCAPWNGPMSRERAEGSLPVLNSIHESPIGFSLPFPAEEGGMEQL